MEYISAGLLIVDVNGNIVFANSKSKKILNERTLHMQEIQSLLPNSTITNVIKNGKTIKSVYEPNKNLYLIEIPDGKVGIILLSDQTNRRYNIEFTEENDVINEIETFMNLSGEIVTITNSKGKVLRVSKTCELMLGVKINDYIGEYVTDLYKKGVFSVSATEKVINAGKMVTLTQETKAGKRFVLRSYPMFDSDGKINKVIHIGKDVTEESQLKENLEETKQLVSYLRSELNNLKKTENKLIAKSKIMEDIYNLVLRISDVNATVLILGESGVGKEIIAKNIHDLSHRKTQSFIKVNCGAIPESLIESELFGYSKGTFTGGNPKGKKGLIRAANRGTLFLDEIGELPLNLQVKVLQVLQDKQIVPLGETTPVDVDIRVVAATNRNLEDMVKEGQFRKDLYYRLKVVPITIPPLRERKEDIPFFISYFLNLFNKKYNESKEFTEDVIELFLNKKWEGNVRELQNSIERLIVTISSNTIEKHDLPKDFFDKKDYFTISEDKQSLKDQLQSYEKVILEKELKEVNTLKELSKRLSVDVSTISRKLKRHNIEIV